MLGIPERIRIANNLRIRIFELDPNEGMSPLQTALDDKYTTLLADLTIRELSEIFDAQWMEGIKFSRPSSGRYFAIELTNLAGGSPANIVLKNVEFVQSAHVFVQCRAARTQQVKAVHFRIIGKNLADDYATLGQDGFNFAVEWFSAGQRKSVLFQANSMLDLLHGGAARMFANTRRRGVEFENVAFDAWIDADPRLGGGQKSFEIHRSQTAYDGWRRSETGSNRLDAKTGDGTVVKGKNEWYGSMPRWNGEQNPDAASASGRIFSFSTLGNREIRTHSDNVFPESRRGQQLQRVECNTILFERFRRSGVTRSGRLCAEPVGAGYGSTWFRWMADPRLVRTFHCPCCHGTADVCGQSSSRTRQAHKPHR